MLSTLKMLKISEIFISLSSKILFKKKMSPKISNRMSRVMLKHLNFIEDDDLKAEINKNKEKVS